MKLVVEDPRFNMLNLPLKHASGKNSAFNMRRPLSKAAQDWKLIQIRQLSPTNMLHPISLELDNDYYKIDLVERRRRAVNSKSSIRGAKQSIPVHNL